MNLNRCRCGNRPDYVTQLNGLVRISCVLAKCNEIVCARPGMAARAWNEINPLVDEEQTKPHNPVPTHRPHVAAEPLETLRRGLAIVEPLNSSHWRYVGENTFETVEPFKEDEIPVTVEAPVSADDIVGLAVATVWHQGYACAEAPYVRRALTDMVSRELPIRGPEVTAKMAKAYATQLQYPVCPLCKGCGYPDDLGFICDAIRSAACHRPDDELPTDPTGGAPDALGPLYTEMESISFTGKPDE